MKVKENQIWIKLICLLIVLSMILSSNGIVMASENVAKNDEVTSIIGISSVEDLKNITDDLSGKYVLTKDIDLSNEKFMPIGVFFQNKNGTVVTDNTCDILGVSTRCKENSHIGFDFENVWKITEGGARLLNQKSDELNLKREKSYINVLSFTEIPKKTASLEKGILVDELQAVSKSIEDEINGIESVPVIASVDVTSGDYTYFTSGANATITGYVGDSTNFFIPSTIDGYIVTRIDANAYASCTKIENINLPNTITSIGSYAFSDCTGLTSVTMNYNSTVEYEVSIEDG